MNNKRERNLTKHIIIACFLTATILYFPLFLVNTHSFQQWFLKTYHPLAPWQVEFQTMHLQPWPLKIKVSDFTMIHPDGHQIHIQSLFGRVKLWRLMRGQIAVDQLKIDSPTITLAQSAVQTKKEKKGFKIRTLLVLQNLRLDHGEINNLHLNLPENQRLSIQTIALNLKPAFLGEGRLGLDFKEIEFQKADQKQNRIANLQLSVKTNFDHWWKSFPYINDVDGDLKIKDMALGNFLFNAVEAQLRLEDNQLVLKKFEVKMGEGKLLGRFKSDLIKETFLLDLETASPIPIPELGSESRTFNIAGDFKAALKLEGKGFDVKEASGKGSLKATHAFKNFEEHPVDINTSFEWQKGIVQLKETLITCDNQNLAVNGSIQLKPASLNLDFSGHEFPLQRFFEKFEDTNLRPIFGKGTLQGNVKGLGKDIHLQLAGEVLEGGYGALQVQKVKADLEITYDHLKLNGLVMTDDKTTGEANFQINYGPKTEGEVRSKTISLNAKFTEHPLETLLPNLPVAGSADAHIELHGPSKNIDGHGELIVTNGDFFNMTFESATFPFHLTPKKLDVEGAQWIFSNGNVDFVSPVVFDFILGGVNISGKPVEGLAFDMQYLSKTSEWQIKKFQYEEALLKGTITPEEARLDAKGRLDLKSLQFVSHSIREGSGPISFDLSSHGKLVDLKLNGFLKFEDDLLSLRLYPLTTENLKGTLHFRENKIETESLTGLWGVGSFEMKGSLLLEQFKPKTFDLALKGNQIYFRTKDKSFRMEYDADLTLRGTLPQALLKGSITILDGRYTKDFNIIEEIKQGQRPPKEVEQATKTGVPILLDLEVRNLGDLVIDNNVGRIELLSNLGVRGNTWDPLMDGTIQVTAGNIRYLGLNFEITHGFIEFLQPNGQPYLEVEAEQEITDATIQAKLHGNTNNLRMDLQGNSASLGPLEKKDVISLILFGMTTTERAGLLQSQQLQLGPELAGEEIAHVLQGPLSHATKLDVINLESSPTEQGRIRKFHVGKKISDRLQLEFASEVESQNALQTFQLEYLLTDFFILKGARSTHDSYELNVGFRFKGE